MDIIRLSGTNDSIYESIPENWNEYSLNEYSLNEFNNINSNIWGLKSTEFNEYISMCVINKYKCKTCKKTFALPCVLKSHMKTHLHLDSLDLIAQ